MYKRLDFCLPQREVEERTGILERFAACFRDYREAERTVRLFCGRVAVTTKTEMTWSSPKNKPKLGCATTSRKRIPFRWCSLGSPSRSSRQFPDSRMVKSAHSATALHRQSRVSLLWFPSNKFDQQHGYDLEGRHGELDVRAGLLKRYFLLLGQVHNPLRLVLPRQTHANRSIDRD